LITARDGIDGFDCPEDLVSVPDRYQPSSQMPTFLAEGGTVVLFRELPTTCVAAKVPIPPYSSVWGGVEQGPKRGMTGRPRQQQPTAAQGVEIGHSKLRCADGRVAPKTVIAATVIEPR
jgi:hypothetical protein